MQQEWRSVPHVSKGRGPEDNEGGMAYNGSLGVVNYQPDGQAGGGCGRPSSC